MALTIKHENNTFLVSGTINATTVKQFKNHLEFLLTYNKGLTINIEGVKAIDANGMYALRHLHALALIQNKAFSIVGYGCKEIYDDLRLTSAA
jgi:ABC-type transporter Mla MlaB component